MLKLRSLVFVSLTVFLGVCISSPVWATGEEPPPPPPSTPCVDVEKTCQDAVSPTDPISFEVTISNCGDVLLWCQVRDVVTREILIEGIDGRLPPGESVGAIGSYYPQECGESTNQVIAKCIYQLEQGGVILSVYDEAEVTCSVPCDGGGGCTLTPGYWKTRSVYGPAPYDATWAMIGEETPFFLSGMSFYEVLWTEPAGGHAYYILAHAYIAARLNVMAGTSIPSDVEAALNDAADLFGLYTPEVIGGLKGNDALRKTFIGLAKMLDDYNNGISGPGHCNDEDEEGDGS